MKAVRIHEHGGVEKLKYEEAPEPSFAPDEVLVRIKSCALNHIDIFVRRGMAGIKIPFPHILGCDVSGVVADVGEAERNIKVGDSVLLAPGTSCGTCIECLSGRDNDCREYRLIGAYKIDGGYAEYVKVPRVNVIPKPEELSFDEAASIPLVYLTAWHMVMTQAKLKAGEDILILAAGSGVGTAVIQIAKMIGARVIATASSDEKLEKAKELGADDMINYSKIDFVREVKRLTNKRGVDVVVDHVGQETWGKSILSLARRGRVVTCGATTGYEAVTDLRYLFSKNIVLYGSFMGPKGDLLKVIQHFKKGKLKPTVDKVFPLKEAAEAHKRLEERKQFGKLVLKVS
jgi:NADPH:quinone reductase-like Zn-dependent oxidoreductase